MHRSNWYYHNSFEPVAIFLWWIAKLNSQENNHHHKQTMHSLFVAAPRYTKHPSLNNLQNQNTPQVKNDCILTGLNKRICTFLGREGEKEKRKKKKKKLPPACPLGAGYWNSLVHLSIVLEFPCPSVYCTGIPSSICLLYWNSLVQLSIVQIKDWQQQQRTWTAPINSLITHLSRGN